MLRNKHKVVAYNPYHLYRLPRASRSSTRPRVWTYKGEKKKKEELVFEQGRQGPWKTKNTHRKRQNWLHNSSSQPTGGFFSSSSSPLPSCSWVRFSFQHGVSDFPRRSLPEASQPAHSIPPAANRPARMQPGGCVYVNVAFLARRGPVASLLAGYPFLHQSIVCPRGKKRESKPAPASQPVSYRPCLSG